MTKTCSRCHDTLPVDGGFFRNSRSKDGYQPRCKRCHYKYAARWDKANPERRREIGRKSREKWKDKRRATTMRWRSKNVDRIKTWRRRRQLAKYGLTPADFDRIVQAQGGTCAVCRGKMDPPNVDHCHATGQVRGILCIQCNKGIGHFADSPGRMRAAAEYVERAALRRSA